MRAGRRPRMMAAWTPRVSRDPTSRSRPAVTGRFPPCYYSITTRETHRLTDHLFPGTPVWSIFKDRIRAAKDQEWERPRTPRFLVLIAFVALDLAIFLIVGLPILLLR